MKKKDRLNLAVQGLPNQSLPIQKILQGKTNKINHFDPGYGRLVG
jgi:hypothetical protein